MAQKTLGLRCLRFDRRNQIGRLVIEYWRKLPDTKKTKGAKSFQEFYFVDVVDFA